MSNRLQHRFRLYLFLFALLPFGACVLSVAFNCLVDPLWYLRGNRLFPANYAFNERFSKTNLYLDDPRRYDCIIFGSSRVTLLDPDLIPGYRCFNYSFSAGTPREFVDFARYVKAHAGEPRLVIVGVDSRNFWRTDLERSTPDFVLEREPAPNFHKTYLSLDVLYFSVRTLIRHSPFPRYYREDFKGDVLPGTPAYQLPRCVPVDADGAYTLHNKKYYDELRETFPRAEFIGFVPPLSGWHMAPLYYDGTLADYQHAIYETSRIFRRFYDFSAPSAVTVRTDNSYDGEHYTLEINERLAQILAGGPVEFGLALHRMSRQEYLRAFDAALQRFLTGRHLRLLPGSECPAEVAAR